MKGRAQRAMHYRCGNTKIIAHGLCWTCYSLRRQDEAYCGGFREKVLERGGHRCRVCAELPELDRLCVAQPSSVHPRVPGVSKLHLIVTLCAAHHAQASRLQVAAKPMSPLLLTLWQEQHPYGHEHMLLDFTAKRLVATDGRLFEDSSEGRR